MNRRPSDATLSAVIALLFLIGWIATAYAMHALGGT